MDTKKVNCNDCKLLFDATNDNFYSHNGKLKLHACKECIKIRNRNYRKNKPYVKRNRTEYMRNYMRNYRKNKSIDDLNRIEYLENYIRNYREDN